MGSDGLDAGKADRLDLSPVANRDDLIFSTDHAWSKGLNHPA